jgi:hypothetical protein
MTTGILNWFCHPESGPESSNVILNLFQDLGFGLENLGLSNKVNTNA